MSFGVESLNLAADRWAEIMWAVVWQSTILAGVIGLAARSLRNSSPAVRYWLWQILAIKLLLMPFWTMGVSIPSASMPDTGDITSIEPRVALHQPQEYDAAIDLQANTVAASRALEHPHIRSSGADEPEPFAERSERRQGFESGAISTRPDGRSAPARAEASQLHWHTWLALAWLAVVTAQFARRIVQHLRLRRLLARARPADARLVSLICESAALLRVARVPQIVTLQGNGSPFVCGLWRPTVVVTTSVLETLTDAELRQVLLHELAHIRRRDLLWGWIPEVARALYFFHPVAHWMRFSIRIEQELACDRTAMIAGRVDAAEYAQTLTRAVSHASRPAVLNAAAVHCGCSSQLSPFWKRRLAMLRSAHRCRAPKFTTWLGLIATSAALIAAPTLLAIPALSDGAANAASPPADSAVKPTRKPQATQGPGGDNAENRKRSREDEKETKPKAGIDLPLLPGGSGPYGEMVALANGYLEAIGDLESGQIELQRAEQLRRHNATTELEVARLRAALVHAERRALLLKRIARIAAESTAEEMDSLRRILQIQKETGTLLSVNEVLAAERRLNEAGARLEMLEAILSISPDAETPPKDAGPATP